MKTELIWEGKYDEYGNQIEYAINRDCTGEPEHRACWSYTYDENGNILRWV